MITLWANKGCGSAIAEAALALAGVDYRLRDTAYGVDEPDAAELRSVNPLGQVPTMVLDDDTVMTESAAIVLWLLDQHPHSELGPAAGAPDRPRFLRWLIYFPAAIYPMYTVGDYPAAWVGQDAAPALKQACVDRTLKCWADLETGLQPGDTMLGTAFSALDVYAAVMSHWRPGRDALRAIAPRAIAAAERAEDHPLLRPVFARNFE